MGTAAESYELPRTAICRIKFNAKAVFYSEERIGWEQPTSMPVIPYVCLHWLDASIDRHFAVHFWSKLEVVTYLERDFIIHDYGLHNPGCICHMYVTCTFCENFIAERMTIRY